jgi:hypothetical protein
VIMKRYKISKYITITNYNILPVGIGVYDSYELAAKSVDTRIDLDHSEKHWKKLDRQIIKMSIEVESREDFLSIIKNNCQKYILRPLIKNWEIEGLSEEHIEVKQNEWWELNKYKWETKIGKHE